jgi:glycosyltransferase involved in cell wall biosynthesis
MLAETHETGSGARATVIVTPRERFGVARQSLESLFAHTDEPFDLIYVDAGAPPALSAWIAEQAEARGFTHIRLRHMLSPNAARNRGIAAARTPYIVFAENDVVFADGWLTRLCDAADETKAEVVAPLICEGPELHKVVHQVGGKYAEDRHDFFATPRGKRRIADLMPHHKARLEDVPPFERQEIDACEFHCVLARRDVFDRIGPLDEGMLATKEHLDFCMSVHEAGGTVILEPASIVTYLFPTRQHALSREDYPFFLVRWSEQWQRRSLEHFRDKWGLAEDGYFDGRYDKLGWRRYEGVVKPIARSLPVIGTNRAAAQAAAKAIGPMVHAYERYLVARTDQMQRKSRRDPAPS